MLTGKGSFSLIVWEILSQNQGISGAGSSGRASKKTVLCLSLDIGVALLFGVPWLAALNSSLLPVTTYYCPHAVTLHMIKRMTEHPDVISLTILLQLFSRSGHMLRY